MITHCIVLEGQVSGLYAAEGMISFRFLHIRVLTGSQICSVEQACKHCILFLTVKECIVPGPYFMSFTILHFDEALETVLTVVGESSRHEQ